MKRVHRAILANAERRILAAIADRLPGYITPDGMTMFGVFGGLLVLLGGILSNASLRWLLLGVIGLAINWFGDSLDGTLARHRGIERPFYGFYIDQFSDVCAHFMILGGLGLSPIMRLDTALLALLASLATMFYGQLRLPFERTWQVSQHALGPTELRILIGIGLLIGAVFGIPQLSTSIGPLTVFDLVGTIVFVGGVIGIGVRFMQDRTRFAEMDPIVRRDFFSSEG